MACAYRTLQPQFPIQTTYQDAPPFYMAIVWSKTKDQIKLINRKFLLIFTLHKNNWKECGLSRFQILRYLWLNNKYMDELFNFSFYCHEMLDSSCDIYSLYYDIVWNPNRIENWYWHYFHHVDLIYPNMRSMPSEIYSPIKETMEETEEESNPTKFDNK